MLARVCVFCSVLIRRAVTAQGCATGLTCPQVHPFRIDLDALLALPLPCKFDVYDRIYM
jgi:hypothetical protein